MPKSVDLAELQSRLNADAELRARFLAAPADFLRSEGLVLSTEMERSVGTLARQTLTPGASVAGSSVSSAADAGVHIDIKIHIT